LDFSSDLATANTSDIVPALKAGAELKPDIVWVVSNGTDADPKMAIAEGRKLAAAGGFRVNTVVFTSEKDSPKGAEEFLASLAATTGGTCRNRIGEIVAYDPRNSAPTADTLRAHYSARELNMRSVAVVGDRLHVADATLGCLKPFDQRVKSVASATP
jgi:hypothetical protein